ncbi:unnamed protein product [Rotaria sp. Silwood1]|nr:unnamed protein product [Rotaria sp. Silwood1]CAF0935520.1 unnamed protein product [Rotaria sp. Silwood1]
MPEFIRRRLCYGPKNVIMRAQHYLEKHISNVKAHLLRALCQIAIIQNFDLEIGLQLLLNKMIMLLYFHLGDDKTGKNIATWIFNQIPAEKNYYKILDAVFGTQVYLQLNRYVGKNCQVENFSIKIDVSSNNDEKLFFVNSENINTTQIYQIELSVNGIIYKINGIGCLSPFTLTQQLKPMPWLNGIEPKTCVTYTPKLTNQLLTTNLNSIFVIDTEIPSGMCLTDRQIEFLRTYSKKKYIWAFNLDILGKDSVKKIIVVF